jgi:dipeptidyl aminopeptidase/acylaminoacyl peptidase
MTGTAFGHWPSPLRAEQAAGGKVSLSELRSDGTALYWLESRPADGGRVVFVRSDGHAVRDLSPERVNIRSRVHEYGGGASCLVPRHGPEAFAYVDLVDQRLWLSDGDPSRNRMLSDEPPEGQDWAHGGLSATPDGDWVLAVREAHRPGSPRPDHCIVAFGARPDNAGESVVLEGQDFYGAPAVHPEGRLVAVTAWDHPDMPWDNSVVMVVPVDVAVGGAGDAHGEGVGEVRRPDRPRLVATDEPWVVAGGHQESIGQPAWQLDGSLRFASDRAGWWQPYRHSGRSSDRGSGRPVTTEPAEFHGPDWVLGQSTMVELADGSLVARRTSDGRDALVHITRPDGPPTTLEQPCVSISALCRHGDGVAYIGGPVDGSDQVWILPTPREAARPLRPATAAMLPADVSVAEPFALTGRSGRPVHGVLYPPRLGQTTGPDGARPPLIVSCHGGPTASAGSGFDITMQYFTSRGFAVARVDYAGSTGYGRDYRCSLWGQWGVADAEDCVDAALHLAATGRVDRARLAIRGSSAGGLTALNALAAGEGFSAAVALYGVTDLVGLATSTHDFEASYMDRLIGPLPECRSVYEARSPVRRAAQMGGSVLLLQGTEDRVVPPAQAERLRDALAAAGRRCVVRFFEGEGHGFRRAETVVASLEEELDFYRSELRL